MANEWIEKEYSGGAPEAELDGGITGSATVITLLDGTGLPTGSQGSFVMALDYGLATEEKILVASRAGVTLTVTERGYDGTTAQAHNTGASVVCVFDAHSAQQANALAVAMAAEGSMAHRGAGNTYVEMPVGVESAVMQVVSGLPAYGLVGTASIDTDAVTQDKLADNSVGFPQRIDSVCRLSYSGVVVYNVMTEIASWTQDEDTSTMYGAGASCSPDANGMWAVGLEATGHASNAGAVSACIAVNGDYQAGNDVNALANKTIHAGWSGYLLATDTVSVYASLTNNADAALNQSIKLTLVRLA